MSGVGKGATQVRDITTRVDFLEEGQRTIVSALADMRVEQKAERQQITQAFADLREDLGSRARPFPFKEVSATAVSTIVIIGACMSVLNWWYDARSAVLTRDVSALSLAAAPDELAVLKYRLKQLEEAQKTGVSLR